MSNDSNVSGSALPPPPDGAGTPVQPPVPPSPPPNAAVPPSFLPPRMPGVRGNLDVFINIQLNMRVYEVGGWRNPTNVSIREGSVALVYHNYTSVDNEGQSQIHLVGESVRRSSFWQQSRCIVVEMAEYPGGASGGIGLDANRWLAGISVNETDRAEVRLRFQVIMVNPRTLIRQEATWLLQEGRDALQRTVERGARDRMPQALDDVSVMWTTPKLSDSADTLFSQLNRFLSSNGMRLTSRVSAYCRFPRRLTDIVLQFRAAEQYVLSEQPSVLDALGLRQTDLLIIRNVSGNQGQGSGLFSFIRNRRLSDEVLSRFIQWLNSREISAAAAAEFLGWLYQGSFPRQEDVGLYEPQEIELSERVLLAAFGRQELGLLGLEWGETDPRPATRT